MNLPRHASPSTPIVVNPAHLPDPTSNGYSTAIITSTASRLAFVSGQGGEDKTGALSADFAEQVEQAYANLEFESDDVSRLGIHLIAVV